MSQSDETAQRTVTTTVRLPADTHQWLKEHAAREHRSVTGQLALLIDRERAEAEREPVAA